MKLLNDLPNTHIQVYIGFVVKPCNLFAIDTLFLVYIAQYFFYMIRKLEKGLNGRREETSQKYRKVPNLVWRIS